jgi:hypothetical protein
MRLRRTISGVCLALAAWSVTVVTSAQGPAARLPLPLEPFGDANEAVYPAFEGWGESRDGTAYYIVLGYKNRNRSQTVEVPIGPDNRIEPGGPDYGQPTVFEPGRQTAVFAIKVPKDFGTRKLTWTLVANGHAAVVTFHLHPEYNLNFYREETNGNEPPQMKFGPKEPPKETMLSGPNVGFAQTLTGRVNEPVALRVWASDTPPTEKNWEVIVSAQNRPRPQPVPRDQVAIVNGQVFGAGSAGRGAGTGAAATIPNITVTWQKMRGPGAVTVTPSRVPLFTKGDRHAVLEANATATFTAPGEYVLRVEPAETSEGFDGLCCFTFANVKVIVK